MEQHNLLIILAIKGASKLISGTIFIAISLICASHNQIMVKEWYIDAIFATIISYPVLILAFLMGVYLLSDGLKNLTKDKK